MRLMLAALCGLFVAGCQTTPEVTLLFGPRATNQSSDVDFGATLLILQRIGESRTYCGYSHTSEPFRGRSFNDKPEQTQDSLLCGPRWGGRDRP